LISNDRVMCIIGPLTSEAVAAAAVEVEHSEIPLITPTASRKGLAGLSDFVFQVSSTAKNKGKILAQSAIRDEDLRDFIMLVPQAKNSESEAASFKSTIEGFGGNVLVMEEYIPDTEDFSPHLKRIKDALLGFSSSSTRQEESSFFDEIPVWVDGIFVSADQKEMYDILSRIANLNVFGTIIGTEVCGERQVLEFARNIDRQVLFVSDDYNLRDVPERQHFSALYLEQYHREADLVSMRGYDCMMLLLSVFDKATSPRRIRNTLAKISDFWGISGGIGFDPAGENVVIPVYKLEKHGVKRLR
jgi:ABC-type branched-subunit amino acid transport system substrate-binding protein